MPGFHSLLCKRVLPGKKRSMVRWNAAGMLAFALTERLLLCDAVLNCAQLPVGCLVSIAAAGAHAVALHTSTWP